MAELRLPRLIVAAAVLAAPVLALADAEPSASAPDRFKVFLRDSGVYAVTYEDLLASGFEGGSVASSEIGMTSLGASVPIFVRDGGDGEFGPGDAVEFVGRHLSGKASYYAEETSWSVYWLELRGGGRRLEEGYPVRRGLGCPLAVERHLEEDRLLLRFSPRLGEVEPWMWSRLSLFEKDRLRLELDLADLDRKAGADLEIAAELRGWSTPRLPEGVPTHVAVVSVQQQEVGRIEFDGQDQALLRASLPASTIDEDRVVLEISAPQRLDDAGLAVVDVSLVNWITLLYPHSGEVPFSQTEVRSRSGAPCSAIEVFGEGLEEIAVFGESTRSEAPVRYGLAAVESPAPEQRWWLVRNGAFHRPAVIERSEPSDLRTRPRQVDYLMITHSSLRAAIEPLAQLHRSRGLTVEVVDVDRIYDEFSHGIVDAAAIREFLRFARDSWPAPAVRFALLVGDASWDARNEELDDSRYADGTWAAFERQEFNKIPSTPHPQRPSLGHRNLVPTWRWASSDGHAASDEYFADVDGDGVTDLAVGRLPVTEPEEIAGIVGKIQGYVLGPPVGPWRRNVLWLVNEQQGFQRQTDRLADGMAAEGFGGAKVYPQPEERSNELHQGSIRHALDDGQLLVHFVGHGGRYIWRTGPPDVRKNHDLFTLDDVDALAPNTKLPLILSMTCYSAPFDHPTADSIGERFLRMPDRGAIAVMAASWRFSPSQRISESLLHALLEQPTIGEALLVTKQEHQNNLGFVMMFNLIGDPALPLALPARTLEPTLADGAVAVELPWAAQGTRVIFEAFDADGTVLEQLEGDAASWIVPTGEVVRRIGVYAWNPALGVDAAGSLELPQPEPVPNPDELSPEEEILEKARAGAAAAAR